MSLSFVTYANEKYQDLQMSLIEKAKSIGINCCYHYRPIHIDKKFYENNKAILDCEVGTGYWLWKPYFILQKLKEIDDGDILLYIDCGDDFIMPDALKLREFLTDTMNNEWILLTRGGYKNKYWTKRDCFVFLDSDEEKYTDSIQLEAGIVVVKKCKEAIMFISAWLALCQIPQLINDDPNVCRLPNYEGFVEHRHDQSLLFGQVNS